MGISSIILDFHARKFVIISTMLTVLTLITAPQPAAATPFMQGYDKGYKACFSPNGSGGSSIKSQSKSSNSDTGGTFVSCNKSEHTTEYCNGYRAGAVQSDVNDNPDENITPSKVTCEGGVPSSEYCKGYQQGYADEDHAMFSAH
jgi:hypothetical protein